MSRRLPCCASLVLAAAFATAVAAAETIPPKPAQWFTDEARVVSAPVADQLNQKLQAFEKETSNQILVAIYPKMLSESSIEDYTIRTAQQWGVGQKDRNNGAVLFVFVQDRAMFIQVGYGLEGALPDALCKRIVEDEIKPHFRSGDFSGGVSAGVTAMLAATRGEYKGTGRTAPPAAATAVAHFLSRFIFNERFFPWSFIVVIMVLSLVTRALRTTAMVYGPAGRRRQRLTWLAAWALTARKSSGASSGWSSGGGGWSSGGGGGGFSSGGGSFGGGGAGGRW